MSLRIPATIDAGESPLNRWRKLLRADSVLQAESAVPEVAGAACSRDIRFSAGQASNSDRRGWRAGRDAVSGLDFFSGDPPTTPPRKAGETAQVFDPAGLPGGY